MRKAKIVLGTLFGDEGKGVTVDFLCSKHSPENTLVVRFSGGHQCGHNVVIGEESHIHASYPSGTLRGFPGYISHHCIVHPQSLAGEYKKLKEIGVKNLNLSIHPLAIVATPFDVLSNLECYRTMQDGSCGRGIGKTMQRHHTTKFKIYVCDLMNLGLLKSKLKEVYEYYISNRHLNGMSSDDADALIDSYITDLQECDFTIKPYESIDSSYVNLIFEGSQGIMLDMDHGTIPNVTYSNTTSKNAMDVCKHLGVVPKNISTYYVVRSYLTRHGNGWMPDTYPVELIHDIPQTNPNNNRQGVFMQMAHSNELINTAIRSDLNYNLSEDFNLVITNIDKYKDHGIVFHKLPVNLNRIYEGHSPDSKGFKLIKYSNISDDEIHQLDLQTINEINKFIVNLKPKEEFRYRENISPRQVKALLHTLFYFEITDESINDLYGDNPKINLWTSKKMLRSNDKSYHLTISELDKCIIFKNISG